MAKTVIQVKGVKKSFGEQKVHNGISFSVTQGKTTIIVGPSGVGKSLLIKFILGLLKPDEGKVFVEGKDMAQLSTGELQKVRAKLGVVFQGSALFDSLSVFDNVAIPLREKKGLKLEEAYIYEKTFEKLIIMKIEDSAHKYPSEISGGMKKRVALARALQIEPKIVLFDEPTTGLDPGTKEKMYHLFQETQQKLGFTALMVSHDIPNIFRIADHISVIYNGKMESGIDAKNYRSSKNPWIRDVLKNRG